MKKAGFIFIVFSILLIHSSAQAQDYKMALGARFSSKAALVNTSISFKYFFKNATAAEALFSVKEPLALGLLLEQHKPFVAEHFTYFYGGGAYVGFSGSRNFGFHGIIGLDYKIPLLPINFSIDWKPELTVASEFGFEPQALGVTARFTFK
jgi:hypothetical protein